MGVVFTITSNFGNKFYVFLLLGVMQFLWAIPIWFMVSEPNFMSDKEARRQGKKTLCGKIASLLGLTWKAMKNDSALTIGLIAISISRNGSMV